VSILATGEYLDQALKIASEGEAAVSVHLNCAQPPLLTDMQPPGFRWMWPFAGRAAAERVRREWRLQIQRILESGIPVDGLDSHQHLHNAPPLRRIILDLAEDFGIRRVRCAVLPERFHGPRCYILDAFGRKMREGARRRGLETNDLMLGFTVAGRVDAGYLSGLRGLLQEGGCAELVMHPSVEPVWSRGQTEEYGLIRSDWFKEWINEH